MAINSILTRTVVSAVVGATGLLGFTAAASGQTSEVCIDASFGGFTLLNPDTPRTPVAAVSLPAGEISIPSAHSWDGYPNRVNVKQDHEIWEVEFIGADGSIVGVSSPTGDVPDNVVEGHWNGSLGTVTLSAPAVGIRAHHLPDLTSSSKNSVHASEIRLCHQVAAPTTTTTSEPTTTTAPPPSGPTITGPVACPLNGDGTPVDPSDPDCPTTTTTAACELDGDGNPVDPSDPDCPTTTTAPPPKGPTTAPPPKGPTLPVTGSESTLLLLSGMWFMAAGSTMVAFTRNR